MPPSLELRALLSLFPLLAEYDLESETSLLFVEAVPLPLSSRFVSPVDDEPLVRPFVRPVLLADIFLLLNFVARFSICFRFWLGLPPPRCFSVDCLKSVKIFLLSWSSQAGEADFATAEIAPLASSVLSSGRLFRAASRAISFSSLSAFLLARSASFCFLTYCRRQHDNNPLQLCISYFGLDVLAPTCQQHIHTNGGIYLYYRSLNALCVYH